MYGRREYAIAHHGHAGLHSLRQELLKQVSSDIDPGQIDEISWPDTPRVGHLQSARLDA
jgi:hypothetical protein